MEMSHAKTLALSRMARHARVVRRSRRQRGIRTVGTWPSAVILQMLTMCAAHEAPMLIVSSKRRPKPLWVLAVLGLVLVLGGFVWLTAVFDDTAPPREPQ